ncbi:MAG: SUF system NifU family Fe-S cluster assembly protein [Deltaproteobacteria bacterium]|nr:SUF system NifU family Fe-S cluster assembly protein [Deltaproteobacteria bacterium]
MGGLRVNAPLDTDRIRADFGKSAPGLDAVRTRADFPILSRPMSGHPLVYLDSAATSQKPAAVIRAISRYYEEANANAHRGVYALAEDATRVLEDARARVAAFLHVTAPRQVAFTRNATEGINLVAHAWGDRHVAEGDEVVVTAMEHHSDLVPWHLLARRTGCRVRAVPVTDEGLLDLDALRRLLTPRVRLVALAHVSNVLATVNPVAEVARLAHEAGAAVLVDAAQSVPHVPVDATAIGADFLAFSGHKMLGPMGIGGVAIAERHLDDMDPFLGGGQMIREVALESSSYADAPARFEAGTPDVASAAGLAAAVEYLSAIGMDAIAAHSRSLGVRARERLSALPGVRLLGPDAAGPASSGTLVTFVVDGAHPHDIAADLGREGIAVRAGHHCAQPLMKRFGVASTTRASFYLYNTDSEVDAFATALERVVARYARPHSSARPSDSLPAGRGGGNAAARGRAEEWGSDLDREVVLDHYLRPAGRDPVDDCQVEWEGRNPLCGDEVTVRVRLDGDRIAGLQVVGHGCSVSVASGSMLASELKGRTLPDAYRLLRGLKAMLRNEALPDDLDLGDLKALEGIRELPVRVKCALLPWTTFEEGMMQWPQPQPTSSTSSGP